VLVDLHAHYPMHLSAGGKPGALAWMTDPHRVGFWEKVRAWLLKLLNNEENFPAPNQPAVTIPNLKAAGAGVVLSVLYAPFDEMDLTKQYAAPPEAAYFADIRDQIRAVESDITANFPADAAVVHNQQELSAALAAGKVALIHAIEGGFQLGETEDHVRQNVAALASAGVGYVTVAHLFFRQVATNAPAIPFLPDWVYDWWFPQPGGGLTPLGRAAIRAMVDYHILIDLTHMSKDSIETTLNLLDQEIDPGGTVPVVATHSAYRFGKLKYNLIDDHIKRIAKRDGVIGLIACDHYMTDGIRGRTTTPQESFELLRRHIEKIASLTGSYRHIAIGTDLDGFIKPTLKGLELPQGYNDVRAFLSGLYDQSVVEQILSANALRLLQYWGGGEQAQIRAAR
jgi:microsomal dipeptidase-like Zn-dependent dipeptidase